MSSNNNNSRIRVHSHDNEENISHMVVVVPESYLFHPPRRSFMLDPSFLHPFNEPVRFSVYEPPSMSINRALDRVSMLDVMEGLFGGMMNHGIHMEDHMMEVAMRESLNHYKTQEKKPDVKLCLESISASAAHTGETCVICKSDFEEKENITVLTCKHILHTECIAEWVKYKSECPICRAEIPTTCTKKEEEEEDEDENDLVPEEESE